MLYTIEYVFSQKQAEVLAQALHDRGGISWYKKRGKEYVVSWLTPPCHIPQNDIPSRHG